MNRSERRMAKRIAKARPNRSAAIYTNKFTLQLESFDTIDRMLQKLAHGELEHMDGVPVVMSTRGEWYALIPALDGWLTYWRELTDTHGIAYDDSAMMRLRNKLQYAMPLTPEDVREAEQVVDRQRSLYMGLPKTVTTQVAHQVKADIARADEIAELMRGVA